MTSILVAFAAGAAASTLLRFAYTVTAKAVAQDVLERPYVRYESAFPTRFSRVEAIQALGAEATDSEQQILQKYRDLIKELHSDTGGTPYIAQRLNEARDACLGIGRRK